MKILIVALPRTGSTSLMHRIAEERKLTPIFEPFNQRTEQNRYLLDLEDVVVKTIINQKPKDIPYEDRIPWISELVTEFNEVILLSRRDLKGCAESFAYLCYHWNTRKFKHTESYVWEPSPNLEMITQHILDHDQELKNLSQILNLPVTYYEDLFDPKSESRLRTG
jgi:hypothetical protein